MKAFSVQTKRLTQIFFVIALLLLVGCTATTQKKAGANSQKEAEAIHYDGEVKEYRNSQLNFTLSLPATWVEKPLLLGSNYVAVFVFIDKNKAQEALDKNKVHAGIAIEQYRLPPDSVPEELIATLKSNLGEEGALLSEKTTKLKGITVYEVEVKVKDDSKTHKYAFFFRTNDYVALDYSTAEDSAYNAYLKDANYIISSFAST